MMQVRACDGDEWTPSGAVQLVSRWPIADSRVDVDLSKTLLTCMLSLFEPSKRIKRIRRSRAAQNHRFIILPAHPAIQRKRTDHDRTHGSMIPPECQKEAGRCLRPAGARTLAVGMPLENSGSRRCEIGGFSQHPTPSINLKQDSAVMAISSGSIRGIIPRK